MAKRVDQYQREAEDVPAYLPLQAVMTYEEVARALGMSRSRVWQIERVALRKIRRVLETQDRVRREKNARAVQHG